MRMLTVLIAAALTTAACSDVSGPPDIPRFRTLYGCEIDPACSGGGGGGGGGGGASDPNAGAPGYWMGSTVTPTACISVTGAGISDGDDDALADYCETYLSERFRPALKFSVYDCDIGMEPYWAAKAFPNQGNVVRIAYLFSYYRDCGVPPSSSFECRLAATVGSVIVAIGEIATIGQLNIQISPARCEGHQGDSEFIIVDLRFDDVNQHWYVSQAFYAAHWMSEGESSELIPGSLLEYPDKYLGYPLVWVAHGKHGSYRSRTACNNGGYWDMDDCNESYPDANTRLAHFGAAHNVGSLAHNFINTGTCVTGGLLVQYYPDQYGVECYWQPTNTFAGWSPYPQATDPSPYASGLVMQFECYGYTLTRNGDGTYRAECSDWGVRPSQHTIL